MAFLRGVCVAVFMAGSFDAAFVHGVTFKNRLGMKASQPTINKEVMQRRRDEHETRVKELDKTDLEEGVAMSMW